MKNQSKTLFSLTKSLVLPFFIPGHLCSRLAASTCLGISIVGFMNILFTVALMHFIGPSVKLGFGNGRIALWVVANSYLISLFLMHRTLFSKVIKADKSANTESAPSLPARKVA